MSQSGIRLLQPSDLPGAMRLKEAAGWNQTAADWERLLDLEPEGCFGMEQDGTLAASATALTYGQDLAWIGMVLTLPEFRGRGFARQLMDAVLQFCDRRDIKSAGLDATDMGIALYRQCGFDSAGIIERWERPAGADPVDASGLDPWQHMADLDREAFGTDRSRFLASLPASEAARIDDLAYAMGRPGSKAAYFGPCVSNSLDAAERLLRWFLSRHPQQAVYWDILQANPQAASLAARYGFKPVRRLTRMYRKSVTRSNESLVFAIAGFECG